MTSPAITNGQQLDHALECHRQHHALVVLGGVDVPGAEQDGERRHHQGDEQRRVDARTSDRRVVRDAHDDAMLAGTAFSWSAM